jgi:hypothetical protein
MKEKFGLNWGLLSFTYLARVLLFSVNIKIFWNACSITNFTMVLGNFNGSASINGN